ncbi:MAG: hypothetical protein ACFFDQ_02495 [Candidatus Thorarchaeota archaeon]
MSDSVSLLMFILFFFGFLLLIRDLRTGFISIGMKIKRATPAQFSFSEFLKMKSSQAMLNQYYYFSEENVKSLGHRYTGRLDGAILHWEETAILDLVIEYKFPNLFLPKKARSEDVFQLGLYALALQESGFSCSSTMLVTIYCLQENAKRCIRKKKSRNCWQCNVGRKFTTRFRPERVIKKLKQLDEVWYYGRRPKPTKEVSRCRICPYSDGRCNYSSV